MPTGTAEARWTGRPPEGEGRVALESGAHAGRFGPPGPGPVRTDPEELLAAALASCFAMALSAGLERAGHAGAQVRTEARATLAKTREGPGITEVEVAVEVEGTEADTDELRRLAEAAFAGCPVAKALGSVPARLGEVRRATAGAAT